MKNSVGGSLMKTSSQNRHQNRKKNFAAFATYGFCGLGLLGSLAPLYWLLTIALKREVDQFASPPLWFHFTPTLQHFVDAFGSKGFGRYLLNSTLVAGVSTLIALFVGV